MAYNILGVIQAIMVLLALISDGKLVFYLEEERLSRKKKDEEPYFLLKKYLKKFSIDEIIFSGISSYHSDTINLLENYLYFFNIKWSNYLKITI
jgi:predicted NodU family carbamoyl transferase